MEKKPAPSNNKAIAISLATCAILGIIGFEAIMEKSKSRVSLPAHNLYPYPLETQNEQLRIELNHSKAQMNELRRQMFVRQSAPDSQKFKNLQKETASLTAELSHHEQALAHERGKALSLESSLATLTELIENQKISKEQFQKTLDESVIASRNEVLNQVEHMIVHLEETIAKQNLEIGGLKEQIRHAEEEKEALLEAMRESNSHHIELINQLTIEGTNEKLKQAELESLLATLKEAKQTLQVELETVQTKVEHEKRQKDELKETLSALLQENEAITHKVGEKGIELEEQIAFEKALHAIEKEALSQTYFHAVAELENSFKTLTAAFGDLKKEYNDLQSSYLEKSDEEELLVFEQLTHKIALNDLESAHASKFASLAEEKQKLEAKLETLNAHLVLSLESKEESLAAAEDSLNKASESLETLQATTLHQFANLEEKYSNLQSELETKEGAHADLAVQTAGLSMELNAIKALLENEQKQTGELAYRLTEMQEHYFEAQNMNQELASRSEYLTAHVEDLSLQLHKSHEEKDNAITQLQHLVDLLEEQKEELRLFHQQEQSLAQVIMEFQQTPEGLIFR